MDENTINDAHVLLGVNTGGAGSTRSVASLPLPQPAAHTRRYGDATVQGTGTTILGDVHNTYYHVHEAVEQAVHQVSQATTGSVPTYLDKDELSRVISEALIQHIQQNQANAKPGLKAKDNESKAQDKNEAIARPARERLLSEFGSSAESVMPPVVQAPARRIILVAAEERGAELKKVLIQYLERGRSVIVASSAEMLEHALRTVYPSPMFTAVLVDGDAIQLLSLKVPAKRRDSHDTYAFSSSACKKLLSSTRQGGTTVFGYPFLEDDSTFSSFLSQMWHMPWWRVGSHVTSDTLVRNGDARVQLTADLQDSYNVAGTVRLGEVAPEDALYVNQKDKASHRDNTYSPFVLAKYGKGRLGFFGGHFDDEETLPLLLAMLGVKL